MSPSDLANRFSNYADAVVAFSVLNALGFMGAMVEEDIRISLNEAPNSAFLIGIVTAAAFYTLLTFIFRYGEIKLREEAGEVCTNRVERYQSYFQIARIAVIWIANGVAVLVYFSVT